MNKFVLAALASASLFAIHPAHAESLFLGLNLYGSLSGGITMTQDADWEASGFGGKITLDHAPNFAGALGVRINPHFRTELELSYRRANLEDISVSGLGSVTLGGHLETWGLLVNGYYDFMPDQKFNPWLSAGLGMAHHSGSVGSIAGTGIPSTSADDNVFAWQAGGGIDYNMSKSTALFAGYRYFATADPDFDGLQAEYGAHELRIGIRQSFN
jgi:OmpA-OmpF porin, OOP family